MGDTGFIQKQNSCNLVVVKGSRNVWSKCADANFHMNFSVCVSTAKYVALPLLIIPVKRLNRGVIGGFNIEVANTTTESKCFINSTLFLSWIELFANSVPDSAVRPLVLVYDGCCSHYNYEI